MFLRFMSLLSFCTFLASSFPAQATDFRELPNENVETYKDTIDASNQHLVLSHSLSQHNQILFTGYRYASGSPDVEVLLSRYNRDGSLDASFGTLGRILLNDVPGLQRPMALSLLAPGTLDERIILTAGVSQMDVKTGIVTQGIALLRFTQDGKLDETFGDKGTSIIPLSAIPNAARSTLRILQDGRMLFVTANFEGDNLPDSLLVLQLNMDGSLNRMVTVPGNTATGHLAQNISNISIDEAGRILLSGYTIPTRDEEIASVILERFSFDGEMDKSFGKQGIVDTRFKDPITVSHLIADGGRILLAGSDKGKSMLVAAYSENGARDKAFGSGGLKKIRLQKKSADETADHLTLLPNHEILVTGHYVLQDKTGDTDRHILAAVRLDFQGKPDRSFGVKGMVTLDGPVQSPHEEFVAQSLLRNAPEMAPNSSRIFIQSLQPSAF